MGCLLDKGCPPPSEESLLTRNLAPLDPLCSLTVQILVSGIAFGVLGCLIWVPGLCQGWVL